MQVLDFLKQKAAGEAIVTEEPEEEDAKVVDLMAALEPSLEAAKKSGSRKRTSSAPKKRSSPAKSSASKSTATKSTSRRSSSSGSKRKSA